VRIFRSRQLSVLRAFPRISAMRSCFCSLVMDAISICMPEPSPPSVIDRCGVPSIRSASSRMEARVAFASLGHKLLSYSVQECPAVRIVGNLLLNDAKKGGCEWLGRTTTRIAALEQLKCVGFQHLELLR
jgi:hypothetical protein